MWEIGATIAKSALGALFNANGNDSNVNGQNRNYHIRGYVNNSPIDIGIERTHHVPRVSSPSTTCHVPRIASSSATSSANKQYAADILHLGQRTSVAGSNYKQNGSSGCSGQSNSKNNKNTKSSKTNPMNGNMCMVKIPSNGNFEIKIKRTEAQLGKMNLNGQNQGQNRPKTSSQGLKNNTQPKNKSFQNLNSNAQQSSQKNQTKNHFQRPNANSNVNRNNNWPQKQNDTNNRGQKRPNLESGVTKNSTWMYLGRLKKGTTTAVVRDFLMVHFPGHKFEVKELPLYKDATLPCFQVRVDDSILEDFQHGGHWPEGVKVTKFIHNFKS